MTRAVVPFYFGLGSRYSYLAATQLEQIAARHECRFEWLPLQSGELIRRANQGRSPFDGEPISGQYDWSYRRRDAEAWARLYQVPYKGPGDLGTDASDLAKACWIAEPTGKLVDMSWKIFHALFVDGRGITRTVLGELAAEIGLDGSGLVAALDAPDISAKHEATLSGAIEDGVFGVPSFVVGGQVFWGNDRLPLVEQAIRDIASD